GKRQYCQDHHKHKTRKQSERRAEDARKRAATKVLESSRENLDVTPRLPSIPQAASPTRSLRGPNAVWNKVIWVTSPDNKPFDHTATLPIQIFPEDHNGLGHDPWLAKAYSMKLEKTFIKRIPGEGYYIHQGLVTIMATGSVNTLSVDLHTWDWLERQLEGPPLSDTCIGKNGQSLHSVLFLHWTTKKPTNPTLDIVYEVARNQLKFNFGTSFRVYSNESEAMQEREKLGDIRALDEVARSSPPEFRAPNTTSNERQEWCLLVKLALSQGSNDTQPYPRALRYMT
ncbi:hypothetical protein T440DRAFT_411115, partial [Plenodomus tracheiphilus IPT5]